MLQENMYVRCPADRESSSDPRVFVCGQIKSVNDFNNTLVVQIHDPFGALRFFENLPRGTIELPITSVQRCTLFRGSKVVYERDVCKILAYKEGAEGYYDYYIQSENTKNVMRVSETLIEAAFNNGDIDPALQLSSYEFQNPCWFMGHSVVSRCMNILDNSILGFKELAGSKIYLLPHQVNTIMRCLQELPCRYMLADEVGMGKTIEAISVLKIYMKDRCNVNAIIVVPDPLKEQWKSELLLKFNISTGIGDNHNSVTIKTLKEITKADLMNRWDFVIIDEVHRYLEDAAAYSTLHCISRLANNVLLLSATPVQEKAEEYLQLLRLLQPKKYDNYQADYFADLIGKQSKIVQKTAIVLDDLGDFEEEIKTSRENDEDPHESEDCEELFEEIYDDLGTICQQIGDEKLNQLLEEICFDDEDLGIYRIKVIISYICANYQIESNVIRNRRKILENSEEGDRLLPVRQLDEYQYALDADLNTYETVCYRLITQWLGENKETVDVEGVVKPLLTSFFSSPQAFCAQLNQLQNKGARFDPDLLDNAKKWESFENFILLNLQAILDDPSGYDAECSTRLVTIMDIVTEEFYNQKIVLFTDFDQTFTTYKTALQNICDPEIISFFGRNMDEKELELNAYRFQNEKSCRIMLCDSTGGEGRNFQCADYIVHIDIPWDANVIEQRIGRLDRLERDPGRPIVHSVVIHTTGTFEEALFKFWNEGLKIFTESLSGMEIIMKDINEEIISAIKEDFQYGLFERITKIIKLAEKMREAVRKEQNYDAASFIYRPMYIELKRLIDYYAKNENTLFETSMREWASLAGFHGHQSSDGIVVYSKSSFSPQSAINSQLIPPKWSNYLLRKQNRFVNIVEQAYSSLTNKEMESESIKGTFIRKRAIENDYLHFFAPGDEIFDCIVDNAMNSTKGKCCAMAILSKINWRGLIFTWSIIPDEVYLLDHGVSVYALGPYRNYLMTEQVVIPISFQNRDEYSDSRIIQEYMKSINEEKYNKKAVVHLGKRSYHPGYLKKIITQETNLAWFKERYPEEKWEEFVKAAREAAYNKAQKAFNRRSNIQGAMDEMERNLSARVANSDYYGLTDDKIEALQEEQKCILEAISNPQVILDSVGYVWMVECHA